MFDTVSPKIQYKAVDDETTLLNLIKLHREEIRIVIIGCPEDLQPELSREEKAGQGKDTNLIKYNEETPIELVQKIHTLDKDLEVVLLCSANILQSMKTAISFSPFLGRQINCFELTPSAALFKELIQISNRTELTRRNRAWLSVAQQSLTGLQSDQVDSSSRELLWQLLESAPIGILLVTAQGEVAMINNKAFEILEVPKKKLGLFLNHIFPLEMWGDFKDFTTQCNEKHPIYMKLYNSTKQLEKPKYIQLSTSMILNQNKTKSFLCLLQDETEHVLTEAEFKKSYETLEILFENKIKDLRKTEEKLRQAQKMEALGRFVAGIAHDYNNKLAAMQVCCGIALEDLAEGHPVREQLEIIFECIQNSAALTQQLLAFSRQQVLELKIFDLNDFLKKKLALIQQVIGEHIQVNLKTITQPCCIRADVVQIDQVLFNLVFNARDAMQKGGALHISTEIINKKFIYGDDLKLVAEEYVLLIVNDIGVGIDPHIQSKIFEPFFTTKEAGKSTGLGLSTVHGIITQLNGYISVESQVNQGSTFKIYLPRNVEEVSQDIVEVNRLSNQVEPKIIKDQKDPSKDKQTILIVEDEKQLRKSLKLFFEKHGFKVVDAERAALAIQLIESAVLPFDLILTDIIMPEMNGFELRKTIQLKFPEAKIVFMSGYTDHPLATELKEGVNFIKKPLDTAKLLTLINNLK